MAGLTSLNLSNARAAPQSAARSFEPLAQSAFRTLGLAATASQREVFEAAASVRLALKLGVRKTFEGDAEWLAPLSRAESDVRDALGRLSEPASRAFERLFWFHTDVKDFAPPSNLAELRTLVDAISLSSSPAARHDAALLALAGLLRLDPAHEDENAWARAFALWRETFETEEFWSLLVAADLNGEFEQPLTFSEARRLKMRAPRIVSAPVAERAKDFVVHGDMRACARAFRVLRSAQLPDALLEEYERDTLGPAEDKLEELCGKVFSLKAHIPRITRAGDYEAALDSNDAWHKFELKIKPHLRGIAEIGGARSAYVRRSLEHAADKLRELAERYRDLGLHEHCVSLLLEARALAPLESESLELIDAALRTQIPGIEVSVRTFDQYAQRLARELTEERAVPPLPKSYVVPVVARTEKTGGLKPVAFVWITMVLTCFALQKCGAMFKPSTTLPPANLRMMNMNIDTRFPSLPKYVPVPPTKIPSYVLPSDNRNASRGTRRRGSKPPKDTFGNTTIRNLNLNASPPR